MSNTLNVAGHEIRAGTSERFFLHVGETLTSNIDIPIVVVHGRSAGQTLCITAGLHGAEYVGIEAATRLHRSIDAEKINGTIIVLPVVNLPAFQNPTAYVNPLDGMNLNRAFPGDPEGSISSRMVHKIYTEIFPKVNYHVDLHGGDLTEDLQPYTIFSKTGDAVLDKKSEDMARIYGLKNIIVNPGYAGTSSEAMAKFGVPSIVAEVGSLGTYPEEDIETHLSGLKNLLMYAGIISGNPKLATDQIIFHETVGVRVNHGGVFHPLVRPAERVSKGQIIGRVTDIWGDTVEEIKSPVEGVVRILFPKRPVNTGDVVYRLWVVK